MQQDNDNYEPAPPCKDRQIWCNKQIRVNDEGMEQVYCCDGECTNVEAHHR